MTCKGCGIKLQYDDRDKVGYSPKENAQYCQRCFRIKHYDDLMYSMKTGIKPDEVLKKINEIYVADDMSWDYVQRFLPDFFMANALRIM